MIIMVINSCYNAIVITAIGIFDFDFSTFTGGIRYSTSAMLQMIEIVSWSIQNLKCQ